MRFNLNYQCTLTLTQHGAEHYNTIYPEREPLSAGDSLSDQFWAIMHDFGPLMLPGGAPFDMTVALDDHGCEVTPPEDAT